MNIISNAGSTNNQSVEVEDQTKPSAERPTEQNRKGRANRHVTAVRLEWLLEAGRAEISGVFTAPEVFVMMNCFLNEILSNHAIRRMASSLCDEYGVELDEYEASWIAPLVSKVRGLDRFALVALADALEQAFHGTEKGSHGVEAFEELEIGLRSVATEERDAAAMA